MADCILYRAVHALTTSWQRDCVMRFLACFFIILSVNLQLITDDFGVTIDCPSKLHVASWLFKMHAYP